MSNIVKDTLDEYLLKNIVSTKRYDAYKTTEAIKDTLESTQLLNKQIDTVVLNARQLLAGINSSTPQINRS